MPAEFYSFQPFDSLGCSLCSEPPQDLQLVFGAFERSIRPKGAALGDGAETFCRSQLAGGLVVGETYMTCLSVMCKDVYIYI